MCRFRMRPPPPGYHISNSAAAVEVIFELFKEVPVAAKERGYGVLIAADSQSTSSSAYRASLWNP
jgi:hypothetical protein